MASRDSNAIRLLIGGALLSATSVYAADEGSEKTPRTWDWAIEAIRGVEFTVLNGIATVNSEVREESKGTNRKIASGKSSFSGLQVGLADTDTGFSWKLAPYFLYQTITISDFSGDIPLQTSSATNIPYIETDVATGKTIEGRDPNSYKLQLTTLGLELRPSYTTQLSCFGEACPFLSFFANGGLVEYFRHQVTLGSKLKSDTGLKALTAYGTGVSLGIRYQKNKTFKFGVAYAHYPRVDLPSRLEFRDKVEYNESKNAFERRRVFVKKVALDILTSGLTFGYEF